MASSRKQEKASKKYYDTHKEYREKKIKTQIRKQKENKQETAKNQKEYYHENAKYREYKKKYARAYRKEEPMKSKARKDRKINAKGK